FFFFSFLSSNFTAYTNLLFFAQSICLNNGNYTLNSTYSNNLNSVLSSIPTNIDNNGFYNASIGRDPDRANAIALCRGDLQLDTCRGCIRNLTAALRTACPNQRQAVDWTDRCMVRYSNETIRGTLATSPGVLLRNTQSATSPDQFMAVVRSLLDNLRGQAADGGPLRKVAARNASAPDFQYIYGLVQCTPDLSSDDCSRCLLDAAATIPGCCNRSIGVRINFPSCTLRYEISPFYNETRLQELAAAPPTPSPAPAPEPPSVPEPPLPSPPGNNTTGTVIIIVVAIVACVIVTVLVCILVRKRMKRKPEGRHEKYEAIDEMSTPESLKYDLSIIRAATNDFSDDNKLGQGGFGAVYKGKLPNGHEIAVKRLSQNSGQGDQEFKNEVLLLAKLQHRNLVRLLGFCLEGIEKLLIYEFVQNASLDQFIFDPIKRSVLDWEKRYKIIGGIARGILYLHEDSQLKIIHRDLKPSNVLLDGAMNPKIADFGMARLFERDETQGNTSRIAGTFGYMAPEYAMHGQFSVKSDVFSFGVLVLEIISGSKNNCIRRGENVENLLSFAWKNWRESTAANMVDPCLRSGSGSISDILRCIHIGLLCVQENVTDRPTMASVVIMLNSFSLTLAIPSEPAFYMPSDYGSDTSLLQENDSRQSEYGNSSKSNIQAAQSDNSSRNDASIDMYPR
ncbi:cysteine-rich receptor-like protein kinase 26, partial [Phtheirospermum japonicum]